MFSQENTNTRGTDVYLIDFCYFNLQLQNILHRTNYNPFLPIQFYCNLLQSKYYQAPKNFKSLKNNLLINDAFNIQYSRQWTKFASFTNQGNMEKYCHRPMLWTALLLFGFQLRRNCRNNMRFMTSVLSIALFLYIDCWCQTCTLFIKSSL